MMRKFRYYFTWLAVIVFVLIVPIHAARAYFFEGLVQFTSYITYLIFISLMGKLATIAMSVVVWAANLKGFTTLPVVKEAWTVVRDLSNMFFIVILLVVAFGTIFKIEAYSWKKLLPKMILAAILVNYSRAICGVIVDAAQVVTITFANAISAAANVGLVEAFHLNAILDFKRDNITSDITASQFTKKIAADVGVETLMGTIAAGLLLTVMVFILFVYVAVLVARLAFIWFLTILSPLAFTLMVLPATEKYYKQWWDMFSRYVVVGPMILFFLWLSLFVAAKTATKEEESIASQVSTTTLIGTGAQSGALQPSLMAGFIISAMMMFAGLKIAQESSSEVGAVTGKALNMGKWVALGAVVGSAWRATRAPRKGAMFAASGGADLLKGFTGIDLNFKRQWDEGMAAFQEKKKDFLSKGSDKGAERAKRGDFLGWLGAAGMKVRQDLPIVGERANSGRFFKGRTGKKNYAELKKLTGDLMSGNTELNKMKDALKQEESSVASKHITRKDKINQERKLAADQAMVDSPNWKAGQGWDMSNEVNRTALQDLKGQKEIELNQAIDNEDKPAIEQAEATLKQINEALKLDNNGEAQKNVNLRGDITAHISGLATLAQEDINARSKALADRKDTYKDAQGNPQVIRSGADLQQVVTAAVATKQAEVDKKKEAIDDISLKIAKVALPNDPEGMTREHELFGRYDKLLHGNNNEDDLISQGRSLLNGKQWMGVLATMRHMAAQGHPNEAWHIFKGEKMDDGHGKLIDIGGGAQDYKLMAKYFEQKGVPEHFVMSVIQDISTSAANNNHRGMASELIGSIGGEKIFRPEEERQTRISYECGKTQGGINNFLRISGRMNLGDHGGRDEDDNPTGKFQPATGPSLYAMANMQDADEVIRRGNVNGNGAAFIAEEAAYYRTLLDKIHQEKGTYGSAIYRKAKTNLEHIIELGLASQAEPSGISALIEMTKSVAPIIDKYSHHHH